MHARTAKLMVAGASACWLLLICPAVTGQAGAQSAQAEFCSDMTQVAHADAGVLTHPTAQHVHLLASDLRRATAAVPPPQVAANRVLLVHLITTNLLGQNTPAIAATEAQYAEMWAQDTAAMFGYDESSSPSSVSTKLAPVAKYVEHACPHSGRALTDLERSGHLHPTSGPGS